MYVKFAVANLTAKTFVALNNPAKIISLYPPQAEAGGMRGHANSPRGHPWT